MSSLGHPFDVTCLHSQSCTHPLKSRTHLLKRSNRHKNLVAILAGWYSCVMANSEDAVPFDDFLCRKAKSTVASVRISWRRLSGREDAHRVSSRFICQNDGTRLLTGAVAERFKLFGFRVEFPEFAKLGWHVTRHRFELRKSMRFALWHRKIGFVLDDVRHRLVANSNVLFEKMIGQHCRVYRGAA